MRAVLVPLYVPVLYLQFVGPAAVEHSPVPGETQSEVCVCVCVVVVVVVVVAAVVVRERDGSNSGALADSLRPIEPRHPHRAGRNFGACQSPFRRFLSLFVPLRSLVLSLSLSLSLSHSVRVRVRARARAWWDCGVMGGGGGGGGAELAGSKASPTCLALRHRRSLRAQRSRNE